MLKNSRTMEEQKEMPKAWNSIGFKSKKKKKKKKKKKFEKKI